MQKEDVEYRKLLLENDKLLADLKHNIKQEMHWDQQVAHWDQQQKYWRYVYILGFIAVIVNGLAAFFTK